jgi:hypothetical protein
MDHHLSHSENLWMGPAYYGRAGNARRGYKLSPVVLLELGSPATADPDGICASQGITPPALGLINGALASGGVATFDVPRNVVAAWTTTAVLTVTGTDVYGETLVESSASGTSFAGKKAFKTITQISVSVAVTAFTAGSGDVLGLPIRVAAGKVMQWLENNLPHVGTLGTFVAGDATTATATTGDVRGTYDPNTVMNGSVAVAALVVFNPLTKESLYGVAQFGG